MRPTWAEENRLLQQGHRFIAGVDEVGRGPLAGPVVAAAVVLDPVSAYPWYESLQDSKVLSLAQREHLSPLILQEAVASGIGAASPKEIDSVGIVAATRLAMTRAVAALAVRPDYLLIDAVPLPEAGAPFRALIHGDALCRSIAAASIIAKVHRDGIMVQEDTRYQGYGFARHKGYGTPEHLERLAQLGPCPIHRHTFAPVSSLVNPPPHVVPPARRARGNAGEEAAAHYLHSQGYQVVDRNFHCPWGEIDIVACQGTTVVFVEVKARRSDAMGAAVESVTPRKQQHLVMAAQEYLQRHGLEDRPWRIDVIAVRLAQRNMVESVQHLENAVVGF